MAWVLTRGLTTWRNEINSVFPGRDKTTDGSVGDLAHQGGASGHNPDRTGNPEYRDGDALDEVRAIDVDRDLVPGSGVDWMLRVVRFVVERARRGEYVPFRYIIYCPAGGKPTIWSRSTGWAARNYTGANRHDKHAHFSGDFTQKADEWTGLLGIASLRGQEGDEGESMIPCKKGDSGEAVKFWQYLLNRTEGAGLVTDGDYGPTMEKAVNAYRARHGGTGTGPMPEITGWMGYHALGRYAALYAGKPGAPGAPGPAGKDGRDGQIGAGNLTVTGGSLRVVQTPE